MVKVLPKMKIATISWQTINNLNLIIFIIDRMKI